MSAGRSANKFFYRLSLKLPAFLTELAAPRFYANIIWAAKIRYIFLGSLWAFGFIGYTQGFFSSMLLFHSVVAVGLAGNAIIHFYFLRPAAYKKEEDYSRIIWIVLFSSVVELIGITAVVYFTGFIYSPFLMLYPVWLLSVAIFLNVAVAGFSILAVAGLFVAGLTLLPEVSQLPGVVLLEPSVILTVFSLAYFSFCVGLMVFMGSVGSTQIKFRTEEIKERNEELRRLIGRLEQLDEERKRIFLGVSHDLRTPLASIVGFSEALLQRARTDPESEQFLKIINTESLRLDRLVEDILDISRQEAGTLRWNMGVHDVSSIIEPAVVLMKSAAEAKGLWLEVNIPAGLPPICGDNDRLSRVITNLLSNAVKATAEGLVSISAERKGGEILIRVVDTGIGISEPDQAKLFKPFSRATDRYDGMGMGLYICKTIIDHHGGNIRVESAPGKGSTFYFTLPVAREYREPARLVQRS
jgi:signal transduction histidine kinase